MTIASMEAAALVDQIKVNRREQRSKNKEVQQGPKPPLLRKKGVHRKSKKKGSFMSKIKVCMAIVLMAHSGLGVVEAE